VGVAAQLPSGNYSKDDLNYRSYWEFLLGKGQAYEDLKPELFESSHFVDQQSKFNLPAQGTFLKNPNSLDTVGLGISAKDARVMSFSARRLMEKSVEALLDSGINYRNQRVGCFMSGTSHFELEVNHLPNGPLSVDGSFASVPSAVANRISYLLDIRGPSLIVDTACSSSLTALHLAISAIESGDCTAALVGAAQINRELAEWRNYTELLAPDGKTKPFDAGANGFGRGEGVAVIVVKLLEDALRDNDHIYSVVLGSAINATGSLMPLNVPSAVAQKECIELAYARAGRNVVDVDYAELHMTGTSAGDHIEANAAGEIFARNTDIPVGSVKGNIGHLEAAAFLVSLLKACLILEHKIIPPNANFSTPSPKIDWHMHRILVVTEPMVLGCQTKTDRSVISLSGAGLGGATGHVVIESPPPREAIPPSSVAQSSIVTFTVGALSPRAVNHICQAIRAVDFSNLDDMRACSVTLSRRARQMPWRTHFSMPISPNSEVASPILVPTSFPTLVFAFSGQGPQHLDMGGKLFAEFPVFRATILELDGVFQRQIGISLIDTTGLFTAGYHDRSPPSLLSTGWPVITTLAANTMLQIALVDLFASIGIVPGALVGHSAGETVELYASGAGSKAMALEIAIARGQAMASAQGVDAGMVSLSCSAGVVTRLISKIGGATKGTLEISCFNSPESVTVSGTAVLLERLINSAQAAGILATRLTTVIPAHCSLMNKIKDDFVSRMTEVFDRYPGPHIPSLPVFSSSNGHVLVDEFTPSYFWDNCRKPVLFSSAISNVLDFHRFDTESSSIVFVEISCHPVLSSLIKHHGVAEKLVLCPMLRSPSGSEALQTSTESTLFTETVAQIICLGYNSCDLSGLYGPSSFKPSFLDHPFVTRTIPPPKTQLLHGRPATAVNGPLSPDHLVINERTHPTLAEHVINGEPILPATGFLEILLEAGANYLWDLDFMAVLSLSASNSGRVKSLNRDLVRGLMDTSPPLKSSKLLQLAPVWDRLPKLDTDDFYKSLEPFATYGPAFQRVIRCHGGPSEVITEIRGPSGSERSALDEYRLHPIVLDSCLHIMLHRDISKAYGNEARYLPSKLGHFTYYGGGFAPGNWYSHIQRRSWAPKSRSYDILVTDSSGVPICEFRDFMMKKLAVEPPSVRRRFDLLFQPISIPTAIHNIEPTYSMREKQLETRTLHAVLDSLAREMIATSLRRDINIGSNVSSPFHPIHQTLNEPSAFASTLPGVCQACGAHSSRRPEFRGCERHAEKALAAELSRSTSYHKMTPKLYDLTKPPADQGLRSESYDMVVALHVLHAVPDIEACLSSLQSLLVPGGSLLVIEIDGTSWGERPGSVWFDCIFGSFSEWFGFTDGRTHCTMTPQTWMQKLGNLGFVNNYASIEDGGHDFLFTAQKTNSSLVPRSPLPIVSAIDPRHVLRYSLGEEIQLRTRLNEMNPKDEITLYVVALKGRDGDSAMGLCATLRRELPFWEINLAIFEHADHLSQPIPFIASHRDLYASGEHIVYFPDEGSAHVSRIVLSPAPATIAHGLIASDDSEHLVVEVMSSHRTALALCAFVGRVVVSHRIAPGDGDLVVGITDQLKGPTLVVNVGCIVSLGPESLCGQGPWFDPPELLHLALSALLLGSLPPRLDPQSPLQVVVAIIDKDMSRAMTQFLEAVGAAALLLCDFTEVDSHRRVDVVITESHTNSQHPHLRRWVPRAGRLILWDLVVRDAIRNGAPQITDVLAAHLPGPAAPPMDSLPTILPARSLLFLASKGYILLGGVGGLGIDLAVWMYQHGARHIILTSRRGAASLDPHKDGEALAKVAYLKSCGDLTLRLEKCDATDTQTTSLLIKNLDVPLAGCFQMTLVLADALFSRQTVENFTSVHDSKTRVFEVFAGEVDVASLDFYIAFSSLTGLIGYAGQSNYASGCTTLEGILSSYRNAFSLVVPGILDAGYLVSHLIWHLDDYLNLCTPQDRAQSSHVDRTKEGIFATSTAMSATELWACIEDGLLKIREGSTPSRYIPDLNWDGLHARSPLPLAFHHLLSSHQQSIPSAAVSPTNEQDVLQIVLMAMLGIDDTDFDANIPLVSYGLDSLSASKLATALRPYLPVTQLQLLANTSWADLLKSLNVSAPVRVLSSAYGDTIVELCAGPGTPLILFCGADGSLTPLLALRPNFSGALWGIQVTEMMPITSFSALVSFFTGKIRDKQPNGPYRLATYSGSSIIGVGVAKALEASGEEVSQLAFIDHFPLLWSLESTQKIFRGLDVDGLVDRLLSHVVEMLQDDPSYGGSEQVEQLQAAVAGRSPSSPAMRRLPLALLTFLCEFDGLGDALATWLSSVQAPLSLLIAEFGMITTVPPASRNLWMDLGASRSQNTVTQQIVPGVGHFGILADRRTATFLEQ
ncbi:hypothetical protein B0H16DRAFT_1299877, partial [Mycena metata]